MFWSRDATGQKAKTVWAGHWTETPTFNGFSFIHLDYDTRRHLPPHPLQENNTKKQKSTPFPYPNQAFRGSAFTEPHLLYILQRPVTACQQPLPFPVFFCFLFTNGFTSPSTPPRSPASVCEDWLFSDKLTQP